MWVRQGCRCRLPPSLAPLSRKKSLAGMKRTRAEASGDSDAEDPGAPPETEGAGQQEEEEDEAEYFRQAVGEEPDEGMWQEITAARHLGLVFALVASTQSSPQTCSRKQPNADGSPGPQARSHEEKSGGQMEALTTGLQRPRASPSGTRPSWDAEELSGTVGEAKLDHLRK